MQKTTLTILGVISGIGATLGVAKLIRDTHRRTQGPYYEFNRDAKHYRKSDKPKKDRPKPVKKPIAVDNQSREQVNQQAQKLLDAFSESVDDALKEMNKDDKSFKTLNVKIK